MRQILLLLLLVMSAGVSSSWLAPDRSMMSKVAKQDIHGLWRADSIIIEAKEKSGFPEPIGFIGNCYQRFYIHYTSMVKSSENPHKYLVEGKTMVRKNICSFSRFIIVKRAVLDSISEDSKLPQGIITAKVVLFEDSACSNSGKIEATMTTNFYFDTNHVIQYDAITIVADGFSNNECVGTWTSYKTGVRKKCNWGDFRIPESGDLDSGAGEFYVSDKYLNNGWQNYMKAYNGDTDTAEAKKAKKIEESRWWK